MVCYTEKSVLGFIGPPEVVLQLSCSGIQDIMMQRMRSQTKSSGFGTPERVFVEQKLVLLATATKYPQQTEANRPKTPGYKKSIVPCTVHGSRKRKLDKNKYPRRLLGF